MVSRYKCFELVQLGPFYQKHTALNQHTVHLLSIVQVIRRADLVIWELFAPKLCNFLPGANPDIRLGSNVRHEPLERHKAAGLANEAIVKGNCPARQQRRNDHSHYTGRPFLTLFIQLVKLSLEQLEKVIGRADTGAALDKEAVIIGAERIRDHEHAIVFFAVDGGKGIRDVPWRVTGICVGAVERGEVALFVDL